MTMVTVTVRRRRIWSSRLVHSNVTAVCRRLDLAEARREPDAARHLKSLAIRDIHEIRLGCLSHGFALCERRHLPSEAQRASCLSVVGTEV